MASGRVDRGQHDEGRSGEQRRSQLGRRVDSRGHAAAFLENEQSAPARDKAEPPHLFCSKRRQQDDSAPAREAANGGEVCLVGDHQPLARGGLAAAHRASYSALVSSAAQRRQAILDRIARAAALARRDPADIQLIAVSKGRSIEEIEPLVEAGQRDFGENRVQEALAKWPALLARHPDVRLHGIGRLQSNKAAEAVKLFDAIHSLDRRSLLDALVRQAGKLGKAPEVYVQVNIGEEEQKGGCAIGEAGELVRGVCSSPLPLAGLMAVPPLGVEAAPYFALLAKLARRHDVGGLSIGMSSDFEAAVMLGATAVRVGTALFEDE
jgi:pyridoxal phosphate enzyme (YggS family)